MTAEANRRGIVDAARAALYEHGIDIRAPWDCDLDDLELERFNGLNAAVDAIVAAALTPPQTEPGGTVREAAIAGWNACRKSIYAVCEDAVTENEKHREDTENPPRHHFGRGGMTAAKSIARGFNSMEAEDDDNLVQALAALSATPATEARVDAVAVTALRRLYSEASFSDLWGGNGSPYLLGNPCNDDSTKNEVVGRRPNARKRDGDALRQWDADAAFIAAAVNHVIKTICNPRSSPKVRKRRAPAPPPLTQPEARDVG